MSFSCSRVSALYTKHEDLNTTKRKSIVLPSVLEQVKNLRLAHSMGARVNGSVAKVVQLIAIPYLRNHHHGPRAAAARTVPRAFNYGAHEFSIQRTHAFDVIVDRPFGLFQHGKVRRMLGPLVE